MTTIVMLPEMVKAGTDAWQECEHKDFNAEQTVMEIYIAMYGALLIARERAGEPLH